MGTDVFMYAERRTAQGWRPCEPLVPNEEFDPEYPDSGPPLRPQALYDTRNSALFAILADVRNPAFSAERYQPIAPGRGVPADLSSEVALWLEYFEGDAFGHTWYLLAELQAYRWSARRIRKRAMVSKRVAPIFGDGNGSFPRERWPLDERIGYSGWTRDGVEVTWIETYAESAGREFLKTSLPLLATYGAPEDVRIVLWFNS